MVAPPAANLIPPWSPEDGRTPAEVAQHEKYREVLQRATEAAETAATDPRCQAARDRMFEALRSKQKPEAIAAANQEHARVLREVIAERLQALQKAAKDPVEIELMNLVAEVRSSDEEQNEEQAADFDRKWLEIGRHLGQLPLGGDKPLPGESRYSARHGLAVQSGLAVELHWMQLESAGDSAPVIADWLLRQNCIDLRYEFFGPDDEFID